MKRSLLLLVNILLTITSMAWEGKTTIGGINYGLQYFPTDQVYWAYMSGGNVEGDIVIPDSIYFEGYLWTDAVGDGLEVKHNFAVVRINKNAFKDNTSLKSIRGGRNLQVIEESAFEGCINLSNVTLSNLTTKINTKAFYGCTSLTSIILPFYLGGKDQFSGCDNLKDIYVNYKIPFLLDSPFNSLSDDVDFIYKNARLHVPKGSVERYKKEEIWNKFQTITGDVELSPGDVIDFVDPATEALCLLNWDTNKDGRLQKTEARAVKTLGTVFKNQSGIQMFEELEYFTGLTTINDEAFMGDTKLYTPVLPENVTSIGNSAFEGCGIIRKIEFPNGITSIGDKAFKSVTLFESTLPDGLKSIGEEAFANCLNLSDVVIPVSVTTIKSGAFNGCQFNNLYVYWKEPFAVDESTFYTTRLSNYVYNHCKLHVPYGTTAKYQATEGWKNFLNIVEEKYEAQENSEPYVVYNDGTLTFYYDGLRSSRAGTTYDLNGVQSLPQWTNIAESITKAVFDPSFSNARPKTTRNWFMNQTNLVDIQGLNYLNTSEATNMVQMFGNCSSLANLDLSQFDTRNVTSMQQMFVGCSKLTSIDLSQFDTGNVKQMGAMFRDCSSLMNLDISNFNTSNVTRMAAMFMGCSGLTNLDISNFNTSNVTDMGSMFWGCSGLTSLDLSNFNTNNVTDMGLMFSGCSGLTSLNVSNFNTSNVTDMWGMFSGCSGLTSLDVSNFNTDNVTQMWNMFNDCSGLTSLDVSKFNTGKVTNISNMFSGCSGLTSLDVSNFNTNNVTNMSQMFWGCSCLTSLDVSNVNTHNVTDMGRLFYLCKELANLTMGSQFITDESTKIDYIFTGCSKLSKVTFNGDVPASIKSNFFSGVGKSTAPATLEVPEQYKANYQAKFTDDQFFGGYFTLGTIKDGDTFTVKTKEGVDMTFKIISTEDKTCQVGNGEEASVDTATPGQVTIPSVANGYDVIAIGDKGFYNCANLTHIWLHEGIKTIGELAFYGCTSLRVLDIPHSITTIADNAFNGCPNVTIRIPVDKVDVIPVKSIGNDVIIEVKEPEPSTQSEIERIFIPKPVQSIGEKAFSNCPSVKIMEVDEENAVFDSRNACNAIIRTADNTLLFGCQNTKIPSTVTAIAQYAFEGHAKLQQIEIPAGVASIGESAFSGCTDLESVTTKIVEPFAINDNTFDEETYKTATLYVPYGTRATYKTTDGWKNFFNIEELPNSTEGEP